MQLRSLGYRTDLIFPRFEGEITDRGDYLVIRTPSNPNFYWGNFLLFANPPVDGDLQRWCSTFELEIGRQPEVNHIVFGIDNTDGAAGAVEPFFAAGFSLSENIVLTASDVQAPPKMNTEVVIRPLSEPWEWKQAVENQIATRPEEHEESGYRTFQQRRFERYQKMTAAGLGHWFGAFLGDRMVADLGLYHDGPIGRFQSVETLPEYRRRGICGTMVYQAARFAFDHMGVQTLVMLADEHYFAARIYESVGFRPTEKQVGLEWWQ